MTLIARFASSVFMICLAGATSADQIAEDATNAYFADYSLLGSLPGCDRPGDTAYRATFEANDVDYFVVHRPTGDRWASRNDGLPVIAETCYRTERRGTEILRVEAECSGEQPSQDPFALLQLRNTSLSISAEVDMCVSLSRFELLDGSWTAHLDAGLIRSEQSGKFLTRSDATCDELVPAQFSFATLNYAMSGVWGNPGDRSAWRSPGYHHNSYAPALFQFDLGGLSLPMDIITGGPSVIGATTYFFLTNEDGANCPNGVCELPPRYSLGLVGDGAMVCP